MRSPVGPQALLLSARTALVNYAQRIVGERAAAEDVVHDAYLRLEQMPNESGEIQHALAYLYRVVRNLALDHGRSRLRAERRVAKPPAWLHPVEAEDPALICARQAHLQRLAEAFDRLPPQQRQALDMHRFGDHTLAEIAAQLQVSMATAHRLVQQALLHLARSVPETREGADHE